MTAYQKRKQEIVYLTQRGKELEAICVQLMAQLKENEITPRLMLGAGIRGDDFLTDVNSGDFVERLMGLPSTSF